MRRTVWRRTATGLALAAATQLGGCAGKIRNEGIDCSSGVGRLITWLPVYGTAPPDPCRSLPPGASNTLVEIDSSPTPAAIYVNGDYVGKTPLRRYLWFSSTVRAVTVVAKPLYPGQARQEQRLQVPHLPSRLTFFMNNPIKTESDAAVVR